MKTKFCSYNEVLLKQRLKTVELALKLKAGRAP